jgi:hypothetical protein
MSETLTEYRVRARNTSADSENKIHDDAVAAAFGFRGGLVPGVTVYGYMTVPIVERFGRDWLERGSMQVKFNQPFYEGDRLIARAEIQSEEVPIKIAVRAEREDGLACAIGLATVSDRMPWLGEPRLDDFPEADLPPFDARLPAVAENFSPGRVLGTLKETIDLGPAHHELLDRLDEPLDIYRGPDAVAHPALLLALSNYVLMHNYVLGPWIHAASGVINWGAVRDRDEIAVRSRIRECFERKGHEFVVLDVLLVANGVTVVQQVRHTAIYRPRSNQG